MRGIWFFICFASATLLELLERRVLHGLVRSRGISR